MSVIWTKTNMVIAHEPETGDKFVRVVWFGPAEDGRHLKAFEGPPWPIDQYQASVDWAVGMADCMRSPIHVEPLTAREARRKTQ